MNVTPAAGTLITATCPDCGSAELRPSAYHLWIFDHGIGHYVAFFCPGCTEEIRHYLDQDQAMLLLEAGVRHTDVEVPLEVLEHPPADVPAISPDDVMEFVVEMRTRTARQYA